MSRVLWTSLFLAFIGARYPLLRKLWPEYKGYAALLAIRQALFFGIPIAVLWSGEIMSEVFIVVFMALIGMSYLVPITRPNADG